MFRFLHAADIHLDSRQANLVPYEGAPVDQFHDVTRKAFSNLVKLAIDKKVDFVLIAGDLADGDWRDYHSLLWLRTQMAMLRDHKIPVVMIQGNHDAKSQMTKEARWTENVHMLSAKKPETFTIADLNVKIHGQGFLKQAVTDDLSRAYPLGDKGCFNIGMLHTSATGYEGHERYAPCTIDGLLSRNYQYWALGHIHKRELLLGEPPIVFPGNIQGRHIRETGSKGCTLVEVSDSGDIVSLEPHELDVVRWERCEVDLNDFDESDDWHQKVTGLVRAELQANDFMPLALRFELHGLTELHATFLDEYDRILTEIQSLATEASDGRVWVETVKIRTKAPAELDHALFNEGPLSELFQRINQVWDDTAAKEGLEAELSDIKAALSLSGLDQVQASLRDEARLREIVEQAGSFVVRKLKAQGARHDS